MQTKGPLKPNINGISTIDRQRKEKCKEGCVGMDRSHTNWKEDIGWYSVSSGRILVLSEVASDQAKHRMYNRWRQPRDDIHPQARLYQRVIWELRVSWFYLPFQILQGVWFVFASAWNQTAEQERSDYQATSTSFGPT